jgi:putative transposase
MSIDPMQINRRSIRLAGYDYSSPGAYFITVVTNGHKCIFGEITDHEISLYDLGRIAKKCWLDIPNHFKNVEVEPFVVMPNHIHGIITIIDEDGRGTIYRAPTTEKFGQPVKGSIPTIIRTYKAAVSRISLREIGVVKIWQRNYYEHIIRNQEEWEHISGYIIANPDQWPDDVENTV